LWFRLAVRKADYDDDDGQQVLTIGVGRSGGSDRYDSGESDRVRVRVYGRYGRHGSVPVVYHCIPHV